MMEPMRRQFTDHLGRAVNIDRPLRRIVSLCPSITQTLFALSAGDRLIARTRYCIHPQPDVQVVPAMGGTRTIDVQRIASLQPDLVLADKEENPRDAVEALAERFPTFVVDVRSFDHALQTVRDLGALTENSAHADAMVGAIQQAFNRLDPVRPPLPTACLIWRDPFMAAGGDTFINAMLQTCGLRNVCVSLPGRYPELSADHLASLQPRLVLLTSEPYPFLPTHIEELQEMIPAASILLVDGRMLAFYGSSMIEAAGYLKDLLRRVQPGN